MCFQHQNKLQRLSNTLWIIFIGFFINLACLLLAKAYFSTKCFRHLKKLRRFGNTLSFYWFLHKLGMPAAIKGWRYISGSKRHWSSKKSSALIKTRIPLLKHNSRGFSVRRPDDFAQGLSRATLRIVVVEAVVGEGAGGWSR